MTPSTAEDQEGKTEVWHGYREAVDKSLEMLSRAKLSYEFCMDHKGPSIIVKNEFLKNAYINIKNNGGHIKLVTDVTLENMGFCRELASFLELRHLSGIKVNFGIVDKMIYESIADTRDRRPSAQYLQSTVAEFVQTQQYFFETLWEKAVPAEQKERLKKG